MIRQEIALACLAQVLFRNTVAVVHADPRAPMPPLRASERAATTYMTSARAREFAAGRAAARRAMRALGQIELVFTFIASTLIFREKSTRLEIVGIVLIVTGIVTLLLGT